MKKLVLIIILLFTVQTFGQRKVMFADYDGNYNVGSHDYLVRQSFIIGYESSGLTWDSLREGHLASDYVCRILKTSDEMLVLLYHSSSKEEVVIIPNL